MIFTLPNFKPVCQASGNGLWSSVEKKVNHSKVELELLLDEEKSNDYGTMYVYFPKRQWDVDIYGLIYTDQSWIRDFRNKLIEFGFSKSAANDVDYSEQGMQGANYVHLEFGKKFIKEVKQMFNLNGDYLISL